MRENDSRVRSALERVSAASSSSRPALPVEVSARGARLLVEIREDAPEFSRNASSWDETWRVSSSPSVVSSTVGRSGTRSPAWRPRRPREPWRGTPRRSRPLLGAAVEVVARLLHRRHELLCATDERLQPFGGCLRAAGRDSALRVACSSSSFSSATMPSPCLSRYRRVTRLSPRGRVPCHTRWIGYRRHSIASVAGAYPTLPSGASTGGYPTRRSP